jgi:hypothetical protein
LTWQNHADNLQNYFVSCQSIIVRWEKFAVRRQMNRADCAVLHDELQKSSDNHQGSHFILRKVFDDLQFVSANWHGSFFTMQNDFAT